MTIFVNLEKFVNENNNLYLSNLVVFYGKEAIEENTLVLYSLLDRVTSCTFALDYKNINELRVEKQKECKCAVFINSYDEENFTRPLLSGEEVFLSPGDRWYLEARVSYSSITSKDIKLSLNSLEEIFEQETSFNQEVVVEPNTGRKLNKNTLLPVDTSVDFTNIKIWE